MIKVDVIVDDGNCLVCPKCGFNYLHHGKIDNYHRKEDSEYCYHTTVDGYYIEARCDDNKHNPSTRRDGLTIDFYCEGCQKTSKLCIAQHKGQTLVRWR